MIFETPFDEKTYEEQVKLNFGEVWKNNVQKHRKILLLSIGGMLYGLFIVFRKDNIGFIIFGIGLHYFINFLNHYFFYKKNKKKYFNLTQNEIVNENKVKQNTVWNFNQDFFGMKNYKYDVKIKWEAFCSYRIIENHLFLDIEPKTGYSYIIGKKEIGAENFDKVLALVKENISLEIQSI